MKSVIAIGGLALALSTALAQAQVYRFEVPLEGTQEAPNAGDPDGSGLAILYIDAAQNSITWDITVQDIDLPITLDHIHMAPAGVSGPVRVDFMSMLEGGPIIDADLAGVLANPSGWYVNVHNATYPAGAVRGQIGDGVLVPEASTVVSGLAMIGLGVGTWWQRRRQARV